MLLPELLDPQGNVVRRALHHLGVEAVKDVRVGKHIVLKIEATSEEEALKIARKACEELLANPVVETYTLRLEGEEIS